MRPHASSSRKRWALGSAVVVLLAAALAVGCVEHLVAMPGRSFSGAPPPADAALADRLGRTITHLSVEVGVRNLPQAPQALADTAAWLEGELRALGPPVEVSRFEVGSWQAANVGLEVPGATHPSRVVVVGAHYDTAPGTPGADDNATGVAVTLELARRFAARRPASTVRFLFFANEEPPFFRSGDMGSVHAAAASTARHEQVAAMLSLETMGYASSLPGSQHAPWPLSKVVPGTGDFIAFVGEASARPLVERCVGLFRANAQVPSEGVAAPGFLPGIDWSDHQAYTRAGFPALMVTDTAPFRNPHYHQVDDLPATLNLDFLARVTDGLDAVVSALAAD